ncbi:putative ribonuclease H protein [Vitis vinifera]|uniref:Putative ribonuclease H protein n=1 Tax=Vitis vinifera TaxID=29760 RepID=A0A438DLS2_VITVI|nr:putative ribonuclease H protein [Vitis vinifera]
MFKESQVSKGMYRGGRSYADVVAEEGPRNGASMPVGEWARAVICENWFDVGKAIARRMGMKGMMSVTPISDYKGCFFVDSKRRAHWLQDQGSLTVRGGVIAMRRCSAEIHFAEVGEGNEGGEGIAEACRLVEGKIVGGDASKCCASSAIRGGRWSLVIYILQLQSPEKMKEMTFSSLSQLVARTRCCQREVVSFRSQRLLRGYELLLGTMSAIVGGLVIIPILILSDSKSASKVEKGKGRSILGPTAGSAIGPTPDASFKALSVRAQFGAKCFGPLAGPVHEREAGSSNGGTAVPSSSKLLRSGSSTKEVMPTDHSQKPAKLKGSSVSIRRKARSWSSSLKVSSSVPKLNLEGGGSSEANRAILRGRSLSNKGVLAPVPETSKDFTGETEGDEGISQCNLVNKVRHPFLALSEQGLPWVGAFDPKFLLESSVSSVSPSCCQPLFSIPLESSFAFQRGPSSISPIVDLNRRGCVSCSEGVAQGFVPKLEPPTLPLEGFQVEGLTPRKMVKVQSVLESLRIRIVRDNGKGAEVESKSTLSADKVYSEGRGKMTLEPEERIRFQEEKEDSQKVFKYSKSRCCDASGNKERGIVILWDSNKFKCTEKMLGSFFITVKLNSGEEGSFWLTLVYGPNKPLGRKDFGWSIKTCMVCPSQGGVKKKMNERASERTRAAESEEVSEPAGGENVSRAENRRKRKTRSFGGGVQVLRAGNGGEERKNPNNHHGKQERDGKRVGRKRGELFSGAHYEQGGLFLALGVIDLELKSYSICIPKGKGGKGGWSAMVEALYQLDNSIINKEKQEEMRVRGRQCTEMTKGRSFADAVKGGWNKESKIIRVEVAREELSRNLSRLEHCLIGSWSPNNTTGETLETLGGEMAKAWGLKGKMGMASMGKGRVLLEFEFVEEARRVNLSGIRAVRGVQMGLECWDPNSGCLEEGETRKEVWVRILGLPMSLWVPSVLKRVGDACGGFLDVDPQTESLEELQWARVLVRSDGETFPDTLELGFEETTYSVTLWWERMPSIRTEEGRKQSRWNPSTREVEGDEASRAATRVEQLVGVETEAQSQAWLEFWAYSFWATSAYGPKSPPAAEAPKGDQSGPRLPNRLGRGAGYADDLEKEFTRCREEEMGRRQQLDPINPSAERMIEEEAARGSITTILGGEERNSGWKWSRRPNTEDHSGRRDGCWDMVEISSDDPTGRNLGWTTDQWASQEGRKEDQLNWEESSLIKFSHFLGFSTEGLEKEILNFLGKIRKKKGENNRQRSKRKVIKSVIRSQKVDLFCIQETKMQVMSEEVVRSLGPGRYLDWKALNAMGDSRGCLDVLGQKISGIAGGGRGPILHFLKDRECLWEEFGAIRGLWEDPWCLGGDFNSTLYQAERSRNGRITSAMRRFAQIPGVPNWIDQYSRAIQRRLPRPISDHFPILLEGGGLRRGPYPFKFENMWLKAEGFKELIEGWWQGIVVRGRPSYRLAAKMRGLKHNLKIWNKEVFGRLEKNKAEALQQVERWDVVEEERALSEEEEGDRNTGFFHRMANAHRRVNNLIKIKINGADIGGLVLKQISLSEADALELPFTEAEIYAALMGMNGDKAPEFFHQEPKSYISGLDSEERGAEDLGDYRPISLLGGLYKLLAKVLANRLKKIIDKVISPDQNAFIKGRQILDGSLIANEFLLKVLHKMGFGSKWIGWMWSCISTIKYSMLVNGVPAGFFSSSKGLRQGDPLSPYLFIMGMEVLSALISRAVEGGFIYGCRIWKGRGQPVNITHLLFADDTIVFCEAKKESLLYLSWILLWFEAASGLKINLEKSMVIPGLLRLGWGGGENEEEACSLEASFLSKGGRITLIKSTLASIPLYQMSLFRMPKSVARRLEKLQRNFLWGGANGGNKAHLIKWEVVCTDKKKGGLGLRKLIWLNKALLGKWIWRFARAKEELWKKVLEAKYGKEEFGWRTKKANGVFLCFPGPLLHGCPKKRHCGGLLGSESESRRVELKTLRDFNDWELGLVDNMLVELRNYRVSMEEDSVFWRGGADGLFKVKEAIGC